MESRHLACEKNMMIILLRILKNGIAIVWKKVTDASVTETIRVSRGQLTREHATIVLLQ
jgi:hypothetical protein